MQRFVRHWTNNLALAGCGSQCLIANPSRYVQYHHSMDPSYISSSLDNLSSHNVTSLSGWEKYIHKQLSVWIGNNEMTSGKNSAFALSLIALLSWSSGAFVERIDMAVETWFLKHPRRCPCRTLMRPSPVVFLSLQIYSGIISASLAIAWIKEEEQLDCINRRLKTKKNEVKAVMDKQLVTWV